MTTTPLHPLVRFAVLDRDRWCMANLPGCTRTPTDYHHRVPKSRGGRHADSWLGYMIEQDHSQAVVGKLAIHAVGLCHPCHMRVHQSDPQALARDGHPLIVPGELRPRDFDREGIRKPFYVGANSLLTQGFPA